MRARAGLAVLIVAAACSAPGTGAKTIDLVAVIDGDTIRVSLDGSIETVRLEGINAPEIDECFGAEATAYLERLLSGSELRLEQPAPGERDRFGRALQFVLADDEPVNARLVASGYALAVAGDHDRSAALSRLADDAWNDRLGMWSPDACGPAVPAWLRISAIAADPAGDDSLAPNEETVTIVNASTSQVDLSGWVVRDESSSHRFVFGDVRLASGASLVVHSGCGADTASGLYWCEGPVWSNLGDSVILMSPEGNVVDRLAYRRDRAD